MKVIFIFFSFILPLVFQSCTYQKLFYHPETKKNDISIQNFKTEEINISSANGKKINCLFVKPATTAIATILFLHGNAGNIANWRKSLEILAKNGFQVFIIDYQGFGKSEGKPKHKNLFKDSEAALHYLKNREDVKQTKLIVLGMSIGGHLAVSLTNKYQDKIDALVIEGAFTSHNEIATNMMPWFIKPVAKITVRSMYKAKKNIKNIKIPKLIIHSTDDEIIPFAMGKKLFNNATEPKKFWEIKGKHIYGIIKYENEYIIKLKEIISIK